jgi:hypothetical protein
MCVITQRRVFEILEKGRVGDRQSLYCDQKQNNAPGYFNSAK